MWRQIKAVLLLLFFLFFVFNSFFFTPPTRNYTKKEVEEINKIEREKKNAKNISTLNSTIQNNQNDSNSLIQNFIEEEFPSNDTGVKIYSEEEEFKNESHNIDQQEQIDHNQHIQVEIYEIVESDKNDDQGNIEDQMDEEYDFIYEYYYEAIYEFDDEEQLDDDNQILLQEEEIVFEEIKEVKQKNETNFTIQEFNLTLKEDQIELIQEVEVVEEYYYEEETNVQSEQNNYQISIDQLLNQTVQSTSNFTYEGNIKSSLNNSNSIEINNNTILEYQNNTQDNQNNTLNEQNRTLDNALDFQNDIQENLNNTLNEQNNTLDNYQNNTLDNLNNNIDNLNKQIQTYDFTKTQIYFYYFKNGCLQDQFSQQNNEINEEINIILLFHAIILSLFVFIIQFQPKQIIQRQQIEISDKNEELQELISCMQQSIEQLDEQYKFIAQSQQKIAYQLELIEQ